MQQTVKVIDSKSKFVSNPEHKISFSASTSYMIRMFESMIKKETPPPNGCKYPK